MSEVVTAFSQPLIGVKIGFETIRVTFRDVESFWTAHSKTHVPIFGINCVVQGGGPPLTMVHIFDLPAQFSDDPVKQVLSGFGEVRNVKRQKYIGRPDIETGTRLVLMAFRVIPPRLVSIDGYFCRLWFKGQPIICNLCNVLGHKSADCPNRDKCRRCGVSGHFARSCPNARGSERSSNTGVTSVEDFPPLSSTTRPRSAGHPPSTSASASAAISTDGFDSIVDDACDSYLDGCSVFSGISDDSDRDIDFSSVGSVKSPVRPASMETRRVENTRLHDAGKDIDVNNVNCSSSAASVVDGPAASFDVNNNIDSSDLSPVNNIMTFTGSVTAANGGPNTFSDLNLNAFSGTASAPVNSSCSKVTAAASGASVYSNLKTVTVEANANSGVNVNTHCDSNIDANSSSNKTATATSSKDVHSISKTLDIETTANSGVNVNILCDSNIEVNSTSNKSADETSCGNVHSISKIVNVEATANSGDSSSNVNVDAETTENCGVGANMSNDKAIDKGTVDSGAPLNDDVDLNNIDMLPDNNLNDSTVVTEVLSSGRAGPVPGVCEVFLDVDASLEAGLFSPDGKISECSLNDAQILPSSSEVLDSQSILLGASDISGGTGPTREVEASSSDGDALNGAGGGQPPAPPSGDTAFQSSLRGLRSRGKAKSSALRSLSRLKDRVAPVVLNRSSRKPSRIPKPAVASVTPRVTRARSRHSQ